MTDESDRLYELFAEARQRPPDERTAFLVEACQGDQSLRHELKRMLAQAEQAEEESLFDHDAPEAPVGNPLGWVSGAPHIPGYEIQEVLGQGGQGVVYKARQTAFDRIVGLKVLKLGALADRGAVNRLQTEVRLLARLNHPHIVQVYDLGQFGDPPQWYFALEFCAGGGLDDLLKQRLTDRRCYTPREAAELVRTLAIAVGVAHAESIVHRDLKPANVLLDSAGSMKVTDFGLAKDINVDETMTLPGLALGTPAYMAPEQTLADGSAVTPATDVWALGVILYELLTGKRPFQASDLLGMWTKIQQEEPPSPRRFARIPRDLEVICLKCLDKTPGKRYSDGTALAEDLGRFLAGHSIEARPVSSTEKVARWVGRQPVVASLLALVVLSLSGGMVATSWFAAVAQRQAKTLRGQKVVVQRQAKTLRGQKEDLTRQRDFEARRAAQERHSRLMTAALRAWEQQDLARAERLLAATPHRDVAYYYVRRLCLRNGSPIELGRRTKVTSLGWSPEGAQFVSAEADGRLEVWDSRTGESQYVLQPDHPEHIATCVAWSPDGGRILSGSRDTTIKIWDVFNQETRSTLQGHTGAVTSVAWSPDDLSVLSGSLDRCVRIWNTTTGETQQILRGHTDAITSVAWSPCGEFVLSGSLDNTVRLWDATTGEPRGIFRGHTDDITCVVWSPTGKRILSGSRDHTAKIWNLEGQVLLTLSGPAHPFACATWSADSLRILGAFQNGEAAAWSATTGSRKQTLRVRSKDMGVAAWASGGQRIVSGASDGTLRTRDFGPVHRKITLRHREPHLKYAAWGPEATIIITAPQDSWRANIWTLPKKQERLVPKSASGSVTALAISPDGSLAACASSTWGMTVWNSQTGDTVESGNDELPITSLTFCPKARHLTWGTSNGKVKCWDLKTGERSENLQEHTKAVLSIAWSPDGHSLLSGSLDHTARIVRISPKEPRRLTLEGHTDAVTTVAWNPNSLRVLSGSRDNTVRIWDAVTGETQQILRGHTDDVTSVAWSPDGQKFVTGSKDQTVKIWSVQGEELLTLSGPACPLVSVTWSSQTRRVFGVFQDGEAVVWDATTGEQLDTFWVGAGRLHAAWRGNQQSIVAAVTVPEQLTDQFTDREREVAIWAMSEGKQNLTRTLKARQCPVTAFATSPDGSLAATGSSIGTVRLWDLSTGKLVQSVRAPHHWPGKIRGPGEEVINLAFSPDGAKLLYNLEGGTVVLWDLVTDRRTWFHDHVKSISWNPSGKAFAYSSGSLVKICDAFQPVQEQPSFFQPNSLLINSD